MGNIPFMHFLAAILCLNILIVFFALIKKVIVAQLGSTFDNFLFECQLIVMQEMHNQAQKFSIYLLLPAPVSSTNNKWNVDSLPTNAIRTFFPSQSPRRH